MKTTSWEPSHGGELPFSVKAGETPLSEGGLANVTVAPRMCWPQDVLAPGSDMANAQGGPILTGQIVGTRHGWGPLGSPHVPQRATGKKLLSSAACCGPP